MTRVAFPQLSSARCAAISLAASFLHLGLCSVDGPSADSFKATHHLFPTLKKKSTAYPLPLLKKGRRFLRYLLAVAAGSVPGKKRTSASSAAPCCRQRCPILIGPGRRLPRYSSPFTTISGYFLQRHSPRSSVLQCDRARLKQDCSVGYFFLSSASLLLPMQHGRVRQTYHVS
ncbi:unnamed protein product [Urochloa humidicola]